MHQGAGNDADDGDDGHVAHDSSAQMEVAALSIQQHQVGDYGPFIIENRTAIRIISKMRNREQLYRYVEILGLPKVQKL